MTLIGPKPKKPESPLYPTPWAATPYGIADANGHRVGSFDNSKLAQEVVEVINKAYGTAPEKVDRVIRCLGDDAGNPWYELGPDRWFMGNRELTREESIKTAQSRRNCGIGGRPLEYIRSISGVSVNPFLVPADL